MRFRARLVFEATTAAARVVGKEAIARHHDPAVKGLGYGFRVQGLGFRV